MACGAAVILCDVSGLGGMVTRENFDELRRLNFGRRSLRQPVSTSELLREMVRYSAVDGQAVAGRVRREANLDSTLDQLLEIYREVIAEHRQSGTTNASQEGPAAAESMRWLTPYIQEIHTQRGRFMSVVSECERSRKECEQLRLECERLRMDGDALREQIGSACAGRDFWERAYATTVLDQAALLAARTEDAATIADLQEDNAQLRQQGEAAREQLSAVSRSRAVRLARRLRSFADMPGLGRWRRE
jgi:hypothetical protein